LTVAHGHVTLPSVRIRVDPILARAGWSERQIRRIHLHVPVHFADAHIQSPFGEPHLYILIVEVHKFEGRAIAQPERGSGYSHLRPRAAVGEQLIAHRKWTVDGGGHPIGDSRGLKGDRTTRITEPAGAPRGVLSPQRSGSGYSSKEQSP